MRKWVRWQDWLNLLLGVYLLFLPLFTQDSSDSATVWAAEVLGILIILVAVWALAMPASQWPEWSNVVLGVILFIAPWVFGYSDLTGASWNAWIVGIVVAVLAAWALVPARQVAKSLPKAG